MRRSERQITDPALVDQILARATVLYLGLVDGEQAYVVPMNFGCIGRCLYLHSALAGRKMDLLRRNPRVSFTVVLEQAVVPAPSACDWSARYRSVMGTGRASVVEDPAERAAALNSILGKFAPGPFIYEPASLARTAIIRVDVESLSGKQAGYP